MNALRAHPVPGELFCIPGAVRFGAEPSFFVQITPGQEGGYRFFRDREGIFSGDGNQFPESHCRDNPKMPCDVLQSEEAEFAGYLRTVPDI